MKFTYRSKSIFLAVPKSVAQGVTSRSNRISSREIRPGTHSFRDFKAKQIFHQMTQQSDWRRVLEDKEYSYEVETSIESVDHVVALWTPKSSGVIVESGIAIALGKPITVIAPSLMLKGSFIRFLQKSDNAVNIIEYSEFRLRDLNSSIVEERYLEEDSN